MDGSNFKVIFLTVLEAELSKNKVLADLVPDEILSLVCGWVPHTQERDHLFVPLLLLHQSHHEGSTLMT